MFPRKHLPVFGAKSLYGGVADGVPPVSGRPPRGLRALLSTALRPYPSSVELQPTVRALRHTQSIALGYETRQLRSPDSKHTGPRAIGA